MPDLAKKLRESGIQPGIWYVYYGITAKVFPPLGARSVTPNTSTPPCPKCSTTSRRTSTPSQAGVTSSSSTISLAYDVLGRWGFEMGDELTDSGWRFADETRTTAEILIELYKRILAAAGDAIVMGCNCFGHLGAAHAPQSHRR